MNHEVCFICAVVDLDGVAREGAVGERDEEVAGDGDLTCFYRIDQRFVCNIGFVFFTNEEVVAWPTARGAKRVSIGVPHAGQALAVTEEGEPVAEEQAGVIELVDDLDGLEILEPIVQLIRWLTRDRVPGDITKEG